MQINQTAPNFKAQSNLGEIDLYDYLGDSWGVLFSHPKNFTPVCTTELGTLEKLIPEFNKRNVRVIGLSVDTLGNHDAWLQDIEETQGAKPFSYHDHDVVWGQGIIRHSNNSDYLDVYDAKGFSLEKFKNL